MKNFGEVVEWLMALGCKPSVLRNYGGSNPPLSTSILQDPGCQTESWRMLPGEAEGEDGPYLRGRE